MKKNCLFLPLLAVVYGAQAQTSPPAALAAQLQSGPSPAHGAGAQLERYTIYAIRFASAAHPLPISGFADKGPTTDSVNMDFMVWLIKGAGKNILVDAGFQKDIPEGKYFELANYIRPDSALAKIALNPEDITDIILSHPHLDHIDGIGLFPKAHIWVRKDDYGYFVGAAWQNGNNGDNGGFSQRDVRMLVDLNLAGRVTLVDGDNKEIPPPRAARLTLPVM